MWFFFLKIEKMVKKLCKDIHRLTMDVTPTPISTANENNKENYSGKEKDHVFKSQIILNIDNKLILDIFVSNGKNHDFNIFKKFLSIKENKDIIKNSNVLNVDLGYIGISFYYQNVLIPFKSSKNIILTEDKKQFNKKVRSERAPAEHINRFIKGKYQSFKFIFRRSFDSFKNFTNIIKNIYNYELLNDLCNFY